MNPMNQQPETAEAYCKCGEAKRIKGDLDGALADFNRAIELKPDFAVAYNNRALIKKQKGDPKGALEDYDKAIALKPDIAQIFVNRGALRRVSSDPDGALTDFDRAIEIKPDFHEAYNYRGETRRVNCYQFDEAITDFDKAIELKPDFAIAYNNRALAKLSKGDRNGALSDCDKAISLKPDQPLYYVNRGEVKKHLGDFVGALADFDRAIELKPDGLTWSHRAMIKYAQGDLDGALNDCDKAIQLAPNSNTVKARRNLVLKEKNDRARQETENTLALRTDFSDEASWQTLCGAIQNPKNSSDDFIAYVDFVNDKAFEGLTAEQLPSFLSDDSQSFAFIIDKITLSNSEHPVLVVDLQDEPGQTFRVIASELWAVENNLSIANMGFEEFASRVDNDGVFRGFQNNGDV